MGQQIIICVEADRKSKTDYIYIKATIDHFYNVNQAMTRLTPIYMEGKGNYSSRKISKSIENNEKQYRVTGNENSTVVLLCFDCDDFDRKPEDLKFLEDASRYCEEKGYRFGWFCKDIEHVYLGEQVSNNQKKAKASQFAQKRLIDQVEIEKMRAKSIQIQRSNLCSVLDEYLERK